MYSPNTFQSPLTERTKDCAVANYAPSRRHERRAWHSEIRVVEGGNVLAGHAKDICEAGLGVVLSRPVGKGQTVKVELPKIYKSATMVLNAVVRYQKDQSHGLEFVSITDAQQHIIRQLLKDKKSQA